MSLFAQLERMGKDSAIPETHKAPMLLASIDPECSLESTSAALRTKDPEDLTWEYVATTLIDEYNAKKMMSFPNTSSKNKGRRGRRNKRFSKGRTDPNDNASDNDSEIEKAVNAFTVALKSSKDNNAMFCNRQGHIESKCFMNPANPNHRLPPKMLEAMTSGNSENGEHGKRSKVEIAGSVIESTNILPPDDSNTYADSGATIHLFNNKKYFVFDSLKPCDKRTVYLADKSEVDAWTSLSHSPVST